MNVDTIFCTWKGDVEPLYLPPYYDALVKKLSSKLSSCHVEELSSDIITKKERECVQEMQFDIKIPQAAHRHVLQSSDMDAIPNGNWFNDVHMHATNQLLCK